MLSKIYENHLHYRYQLTAIKTKSFAFPKMLRVQWLASKLIQPRQCHPGVASNVFRIIKPTYKYKNHSGASVVPDFHRCCFVAAVVDSLFDDGAIQAILPKARSCKLRTLRIRFYLKPAQLLGCSNLFVY